MMSIELPNSHPDRDCQCMQLQSRNINNFIRCFVGIDETYGRFGEVTVESCKYCGSKWIHYFVEYEAYRESGRWFRGLVNEEILAELTPETAIEILDRLPWHFYGGCYFSSTGGKGIGKVSHFVD